jgi:hypothetical protein
LDWKPDGEVDGTVVSEDVHDKLEDQPDVLLVVFDILAAVDTCSLYAEA